MAAGTMGRMAVELVVGIVVGIVLLWIALVALLWLLRPRDVAMGDLVRVVPDLARLSRSLVADRTTPLGVRVALVVLVIWILNPVDLIPEFIPVLGPLDDVIVAVLVLRYVRRRMGSDVLRERWPGTADGFSALRRLIG